MGLEVGSFISDLVPSNPVGATDAKAQGDDHLRLIKTVAKATFPQGNRAIRTNEIGGVYQAKTAGFTVDATHAGAFFDCTSGTFTIALTAAATLGANFGFRVRNSGSGVITINPAGAELVNAAATYDLSPGDSIAVTCDGAAWHALAGGLASNRAHMFTALQTIQLSAVGDPAMKIVSTDAGAAAGPFFTSYRDSASPAADDAIGGLKFTGEDSAGNEQLYGAVTAAIKDATTTQEDGETRIHAEIAGVDTIIARFAASAFAGGAVAGAFNFNEPRQNNQLFTPRGHIDGLKLANNAGDANNDIDIAVGQATDDTGVQVMNLTGALTKRLDANWVVGTNQGGLDTGSEAASTWYHVWLIRRPDTGVVDVLFSASASSPTMPANYTQKRRIGAIFNDSGSAIKAFSQEGEEFRWKVVATDATAVNNLSTTAASFTLTVPLGVKVIAIVNAVIADAAAAVTYIYSPDETDQAADETIGVTNTRSGTAGASSSNPVQLRVRTNTSSQIRAVASANNLDLKLGTVGWIDPRGKDA